MAETTRHAFQEELQHLEDRTMEGLDIVVSTLDGRYLEVHQGVLSLLARQAPVATDLRVVAAILHVIRNFERMGDQCVNICKLLPLEGHDPPRRQEMLAKIAAMGAQARA